MKIKIFGRTLFIRLLTNRKPNPPTRPKFKKGLASEDWWSSFCYAGSIVADCLCGRTNFIDSEDAGDWERGELEHLRELAKEKPDKYVADCHGNDTVSISSIGLIWNCPCGESAKHEQYLLDNRSSILSYYLI